MFLLSLPLSPLQAGRGQPDVHKVQGGVWETLYETLYQQSLVCIYLTEPEAGGGGAAQRNSHSFPPWVSPAHQQAQGASPQGLCPSKTGTSSLWRKACTTRAVCFPSQKESLCWWLTWIMLVAGFSSHCIKLLVYQINKTASSVGTGRGQSGLLQTSGSRNPKFLRSQWTWSLTEITAAKAWVCTCT